MPFFDSHSGDRGVVIDRDTGKVVPHAIQGNTEEGWVECYAVDENGDLVTGYNGLKREKRRGRFIWIRETTEELPWHSII